jgi:hypothetical protein
VLIVPLPTSAPSRAWRLAVGGTTGRTTAQALFQADGWASNARSRHGVDPDHAQPQLSAVRALCYSPQRVRSDDQQAPDSRYVRTAPILERRRHSSAVEQLFRKSSQVCAVLPCLEARYERAHLSAIRFRGCVPWTRRYGPIFANATQMT